MFSSLDSILLQKRPQPSKSGRGLCIQSPRLPSMRSSQSKTMNIMHNIRFLRTHIQKSYPTTANPLILIAISLLPIFTLTALVLIIFHVYFTGLWLYYNERIFVTRGFGEDDAAKCIDVLSETGLGPNTEALEWYWRMQCEGNRDAWGDEGVFDILVSGFLVHARDGCGGSGMLILCSCRISIGSGRSSIHSGHRFLHLISTL